MEHRERRPRGQEEGDEQQGAVSRGYGVRWPLLVQRLHVKERGKSPTGASQRGEAPLDRRKVPGGSRLSGEIISVLRM